MMILKLLKKYQKFLKKITIKQSPKTIRNFVKKEGFI